MPKGSSAPVSFAEGANAILMAISATMLAPDAGPHLQLLDALQKAIVGATHKGNAPPGSQPGQPPGGPPGMAQGGAPQGGGMSLGSIMGQGGQGGAAGANPTPGMTGGGPSSTGASADDMRRMMAASAATAG